MTKREIAAIIDHTLLAPNISSAKIEQLCREAKDYGFASVCVNPVFVPLASLCVKGSNVKVCTVVGFPLGATTTEDKKNEAMTAVKNGADEIDMVIDIAAATDGKFSNVEKDIAGVVEGSKSAGNSFGKNIIVKVIIETCYFDDNTIEKCCACAKKAGADFVKTSTGFGTPKNSDGSPLPNGASEHHIKLMRQTVGNEMGVKASCGIRTAETALAMVNAGATRIGTSSGIKIIETWTE